MNCPYGFNCTIFVYHNNSVDMVRHDDTFIRRHVGKSFRQGTPCPCHHPPRVVQMHDPIGDRTEQVFPPLDTHSHKIRASRRIIIFPQADGTTMVNIRIVGHTHPCPWPKGRTSCSPLLSTLRRGRRLPRPDCWQCVRWRVGAIHELPLHQMPSIISGASPSSSLNVINACKSSVSATFKLLCTLAEEH